MNEPQRIGRYEVVEHLASGGMGHVYLARASGLGGFEHVVVIKVLATGVAEDDEARIAMFLEEARLVGGLQHPCIAQAYEVGCDEDGRFYFVMEYVRGETAEAIWKMCVERGRAIPMELALTIGCAVALALDYAHAFRAPDGTPWEIVHRDVSLSNIVVGLHGAVKLIDFGIAKAANRAPTTQVGALKGKIGYLAPEQVLNRKIDRRTDIFALGIVLYELTTLTRAFRDHSELSTFERVTRGEVAAPSSVVAGYSPSLERIVMRALAVDPDRRFQEAGTLARDLEAVAGELGIVLGHRAVMGAMAGLFESGGRRGRKFARGSTQSPTDGGGWIDPDTADTSVGLADTTAVAAEIDEEPTTPIPRRQ